MPRAFTVQNTIPEALAKEAAAEGLREPRAHLRYV